MKLDPGPLPLYHQLEEDLRARIHAKEFVGGDALPTEEQMCEQYGVSRITVRRALDSLIAQGLIVRRRGVGSFVSTPKTGVQSVRLSGSLDEFLAAAGLLQTDVLSLSKVVAPPQVADFLMLDRGERVVQLEGVCRLKEAPVGYLRIYFPLAVGQLLKRKDIDSSSPVVRIIERKLNTRVARAEQVIEPDRAGEFAARHLGIDPDAPILRVTRVYYTAADQPIEVALMRYHPERYRYSIDYRANNIRR